MKVCRKNALKLWEISYGNAIYAEDFHGNLMCKDGYGDPNFYIMKDGERIYCGWNLHHILPKASGGSNIASNLLCTNIATNEEAGDRITFWIDNYLYQVRKCDNFTYKIVELRKE